MYSSIGLVLIALTVLMMGVHAFLLGQKVGMHARIIATSAIYQKVGRKGGGREEGEIEGREEAERMEKEWEEGVRGGREAEGRRDVRGGREAEGRRDVRGSRGGREEGKKNKRQTDEEEPWEERGWLVASGWLLTQP